MPEVPRPVRECAGKHPDDLLFTNDEGKFVTAPKVYEGSRSWLTGALRRARLPIMTPHDFRHTYADLLDSDLDMLLKS